MMRSFKEVRALHKRRIQRLMRDNGIVATGGSWGDGVKLGLPSSISAGLFPEAFMREQGAIYWPIQYGASTGKKVRAFLHDVVKPLTGVLDTVLVDDGFIYVEVALTKDQMEATLEAHGFTRVYHPTEKLAWALAGGEISYRRAEVFRIPTHLLDIPKITFKKVLSDSFTNYRRLSPGSIFVESERWRATYPRGVECVLPRVNGIELRAFKCGEKHALVVSRGWTFDAEPQVVAAIRALEGTVRGINVLGSRALVSVCGDGDHEQQIKEVVEALKRMGFVRLDPVKHSHLMHHESHLLEHAYVHEPSSGVSRNPQEQKSTTDLLQAWNETPADSQIVAALRARLPEIMRAVDLLEYANR